ncbi:MAG: hypothetical protein LBT27_02185, partial [Prevotellaceae bacterium]|nr:hypothetical protein [Prevotellaceae bacterium]
MKTNKNTILKSFGICFLAALLFCLAGSKSYAQCSISLTATGNPAGCGYGSITVVPTVSAGIDPASLRVAVVKSPYGAADT